MPERDRDSRLNPWEGPLQSGTRKHPRGARTPGPDSRTDRIAFGISAAARYQTARRQRENHELSLSELLEQAEQAGINLTNFAGADLTRARVDTNGSVSAPDLESTREGKARVKRWSMGRLTELLRKKVEDGSE